MLSRCRRSCLPRQPVAQAPPELSNPQIEIAYVAPRNPALAPIQDRLQKRLVLEQLKQFLAPLKLPRKLTVQFDQCGGTGARLQVARARLHLLRADRPDREDRRQGATQSARDRPGRDGRAGGAARGRARRLRLLQGPDLGARRRRRRHARRLHRAAVRRGRGAADHHRNGGVLGIERAGLDRQRLRRRKARPKAQRYFNYLCIAYGGAPKSFEFLVKAEEGKKPILPEARAAALRPRISPVPQGVRPADHAVCGSGSAGGDQVAAVRLGRGRCEIDPQRHKSKQGCRHDIVCASCVAGAGLGAGRQCRRSVSLAQAPEEFNTRVEYAYFPPKSLKYQAVMDRLKSRKVLELLSQFLAPLRLPHKILPGHHGVREGKRQSVLQQRHPGDRVLLRIHRPDRPSRAQAGPAEAGFHPRRSRRRRVRRGRAARSRATPSSTCSMFRSSGARRMRPTRSRASSSCSSTGTWRAR